MRKKYDVFIAASAALALMGCGSDEAISPVSSPVVCPAESAGAGGIAHVIIVVQENHSFDNYFGAYCEAPSGSNPSCTEGPACCEAAPAHEPSGAAPAVLDDEECGAFNPDHSQMCEDAEINGGLMDKFVTGVPQCSDPRNFAVSPGAAVKTYHDLAASYALADRYFQPITGQSSANDMYFAVAKKVFGDNSVKPDTLGKDCLFTSMTARYEGETTIADLLGDAGKQLRVYAEGYQRVVDRNGGCPPAPDDCAFGLPVYPCIYDPSDIPFLYYAQHADDPTFIHDYADFAKDLAAMKLPDVAFVKAIGYHSEHPGAGTLISAGEAFVDDLISQVMASCYKDDTLILLTWDEGGGYYDHIAPPAKSAVDDQPYGTRVPLLAIGRFAKKGAVSHVEMEHSSIVKFLEWNYLNGETGQLKARDAVVNNIGSLLDPKETGAAVPEM